MPSEEGRRKKHPTRYEILLVPHGEGGRRRSFHASKGRLWALGLLTFAVVAVVVLVLLVYTPVIMFLPMMDPVLEQRYGTQILETQQKLEGLAHDMLALRDYNQQLRKALGESVERDSSAATSLTTKGQDRPLSEVEDSGYVNLPERVPAGNTEQYGDYDVAPDSYGTLMTGQEEAHGALPLLPPTDGFVTQGFDPSNHHFGIDFATKRGTPVFAATDGYVVFSGWTYDDGNMIILSHGGGYLTLYKHNQLLLTSTHVHVKRGALIAQSGSTGQTSSGPHLHFEVWRNGLPQDPQHFLLAVSKIQ